MKLLFFSSDPVTNEGNYHFHDFLIAATTATTSTTAITATTATTDTTEKPRCNNYWSRRICDLLKNISQAELNDDHCLTKDLGMTTVIRAHCYKKCCGENCDKCPDVPEILPEHQTGWNIKYELNHALRIFNKISSNPTTATAISTSPPIRRNFWNGDFCGLLKSISQEELNDDHCLTKNPGMTAFIRAHCFMRCCQGRRNKCPNLTKQTLWARQYTLKHALKVFNGISSNRS